jgi:hypothetical protein
LTLQLSFLLPVLHNPAQEINGMNPHHTGTPAQQRAYALFMGSLHQALEEGTAAGLADL